MNEIVRTKLEQEREKRALTQGRLAALADLHAASISRIEARLQIPSESQQQKLARALGLTASELFADFPERIPLVEVT